MPSKVVCISCNSNSTGSPGGNLKAPFAEAAQQRSVFHMGDTVVQTIYNLTSIPARPVILHRVNEGNCLHCPLVIALVTLKCYSQKFTTSLIGCPLPRTNMPWCPCPF